MESTPLSTQASGLRRNVIRISIVVGLLLVGFLALMSQAPTAFPKSALISVQYGDNLTTVAHTLKGRHIIRSEILFKISAELVGGQHKVIAGDYFFNQPISVFGVISRLMRGDFQLASVRVTIPEGDSMSEISSILSSKLLHFSATNFMKFSPDKEGYLFPDTYFFRPEMSASSVIEIMQDNFADKIKTLAPEIVTFGKPEKDIITMASILEGEANTPEDRQIISGILWKRIKIGMPLQVDVTIAYATGKSGTQLTTADLKVDSLYNTYKHKGLPPTPIGSPGLDAIEAAVTPTTTPYLYYLSDANGVIHYAATFAEHVKNRGKYQ